MATANRVNTLRQEDFTLLVKTCLLREQLSVTALAEELGYARNTVSIAINHPSMFPAVRQAIANRLGLR